MQKKRLIALTTLMLCIVLSSSLVLAQPTDIAGHWAAAELSAWVNQGLLGGYPDGTVRPDNNITRAEFFIFVNRAFQLAPLATVEIKDVATTDWYYADVLTAINHGYVGGYPDGTILPNNPISREEVASSLSRFLKLAPTADLSAVAKFADTVDEWSRAAVDAVANVGVMGGYPDGTFGATKPITRAEAIVTLNRAMNLPKPEPMVTATVDKAGIYGPSTGTQTFTGDVTIAVADVVLRNVTITGNLTLGEGIGEGDVTLQNVTVEGKTIVNGGGPNSIHLENFISEDLTVNKPGVRLVATGSTKVTSVTITNGAILAEIDLDGDGFGDVQISEQLPAGAIVDLVGDFGNISIASEAAVTLSGSATTVNINANANVTLGGTVETVNVSTNATVAVGGSVANLTVTATATGANVAVNAGATVGNLVANAAAAVTGEGAIATATINVSGVTIAQTPTKTTVAPGNSANVGGQVITVPPTPTPGPGPGPGPGPITPVIPTITSFSSFTPDHNAKTLAYNGSGKLTTANVTITPSATYTLTMKIGTTEIRSWNVPNGNAQIAIVRDILGSAGRLLDFYIASGLTEADFANAVDFTSILSGITSQTDKAKIYDTVLPLIAQNIDSADYDVIYQALNLPGILSKANDATKDAVKAALQDAVDLYNEHCTPKITTSDMIADARDIFTNVVAKGIKTEFYGKINVAGILNALKGQTNLFSQTEERALFNAVASRVDNLSQFVLAIYGHMGSFEASTKDAIYGNINFSQLLAAIDRPVTITITDTNSSANTNTYTMN